MDTRWFAFDERGQVAVFNSYEDGQVPEEVVNDASFWELCELHLVDIVWPLSEIADRLGLYSYDYGEGYLPIPPYHRQSVPQAPLHVDQLPASIRDRCRLIKIPFRFDLAEAVQPLEWYFCRFYGQSNRVAYLAADGKTVKPIYGEEEHFADFVRNFHEEHPEEAKRYVFEWPSQ
jgi:hypothetical protein